MKAKYGDRFEVFNAGTQVTRVHPMAIAVMKEIGIDISQYRSKLIDEFFSTGIGTVVTVCDTANKACPFFPGAKDVIHQSFRDLSAFTGTDEEVRAGFRRVRNEIVQWIDKSFANRLYHD
jgi:arsenate reductase